MIFYTPLIIMSAQQHQKLKSLFSFKRIVIPILIGFGFSAYSIWVNEFNFSLLRGIEVSLLFVVIAFFFMFLRDLMYIWRLQILTGNYMSWKSTFQVIMLWEFASAASPSMVGGSPFAIFFLKAEGFSLGKSTAIVMIASFLDELFYIVAVAVILLVFGNSILQVQGDFGYDPMLFFYIGYGVIIMLTSIISIAIFVIPRGFKMLLITIFSIRFLRKWRNDAAQTGEEIILTSKELKGKSLKYWLTAFTATALSWTARYLVLNCLIVAINPLEEFTWTEQVNIFAKQLIMWVILLISPTPGASGIAEISFPAFFREFIPLNLQGATALVWRMISYYPYLLIGLFVLPIWLRKLEKRRKKNLTY